MILGVDYYPEQWGADFLEKDLDRITALGCNTVRIGEFGWHIMESEEGAYDFSYFDRVVEKAKERGLKVIMGTPTAAAPAWLIYKYPDVLSQFADGRVRTYGGRHTCCYSSEVYFDRAKRIVKKLAEHFRDESAIIAWQTDNELGHEGSDVCWCDKCVKGFREYLKEKYADIEKLNEVYGTAFWSQQYNSFEEIYAPNATITVHNPSLRLDWERFCSEKIVRFERMQTETIKSVIPSATVFHDFSGGGLCKSLDYCKIARLTDKTAYNNYPVWGGQRAPLPPCEIAFSLDYIRGLKQENFWITEQIMGAQGHDVTGYTPRPGQAKMWAMQAVARGCDGMLFFRYRGAVKGAEQFCYGIVDADNGTGRKWHEVKELFSELRQLDSEKCGQIKADVCIIYDFDSLACFRIQKQSEIFDSEREMKRWHSAFYNVNIPVDVIPCDACFENYKAVIVPNMIICRPSIRERLKTFANGGGAVIASFRTSVKDGDNNLILGEKLPVGLTDLFGLAVEETESLWETDGIKLKGTGGAAFKNAAAGVYREMCLPTTAETLYFYDDPFYGNYTAIAKNRYGRGLAFYVGCSPSDEILQELVSKICAFCTVRPVYTPAGVETVERVCADGKATFVFNHNPETVYYGKHILPPFGYALEISR